MLLNSTICCRLVLQTNKENGCRQEQIFTLSWGSRINVTGCMSFEEGRYFFTTICPGGKNQTNTFANTFANFSWLGRTNKWGSLQTYRSSLVFAGPGLHEGLQTPQYPFKGQYSRTWSIQEVFGMHWQWLIPIDKWGQVLCWTPHSATLRDLSGKWKSKAALAAMTVRWWSTGPWKE